jgi:large subunit ribosomal protein L24
MRIKKGDNVIMLSGKDRSKKGKVLAVFPENNRATVEGLNLVKKAVRARQQGQKGQIIHKERAVSISSLGMVCGSCNKITRVGYRVEGDNKVRICKKCKSEI